MKREYKKPFCQVIEMIEKAGVMQAGGDGSVGEVGGGSALGKEGDFLWEDNAVNNLWGDEPEEEE